jgi:hypothetical protein
VVVVTGAAVVVTALVVVALAVVVNDSHAESSQTQVETDDASGD